MRLTKTIWMFLGIAVIIAAAVTLYMLHQGQMKQQDELNGSIDSAYNQLQLLTLEKGALQAEIAELQEDIIAQNGETDALEEEITRLEAELQQLEEERAAAEAQALLMLSQAEAKFLTSAESIEYDEILFSFAYDANLRLVQVDASESVETVVNEITYRMTAFNLFVQGDVEEILEYITKVVEYEAFKTSVLNTFTMNTPKPLTDSEKADIEASIRAGLAAEEIAKITTEEMIDIIIEAVVEVAGPESNWPEDAIDVLSVQEMALELKEHLSEMVEDEYVNELPLSLATIIQGKIKDSIISKIIEPLAEMIALAIENGADPVDLLGEDIAVLTGEEITGSLQGDISGILNEYVALLIEAKITDSIQAAVDAATPQLTAETIESLETSSSSITLTIYTYEGE
jgi:hypothetical protein